MHLLVIRFSAIGDVALSIPVLKALTEQHPEVEVTVLSRPHFQSLFEPLGVHFVGANLESEHQGPQGLWKLYQRIINDHKPDRVVDLHAVLRTHILASFFKMGGIPVYQIDKGRKEKKALTRRKNKVRVPLRHTMLRYVEVFEKSGLRLRAHPSEPALPHYQSAAADQQWQNLHLSGTVIGIAPMASFAGKSWPQQKMRDLIILLLEQNYKVLLFGGPDDVASLDELSAGRDGVYNVASKLKFNGEIALMNKLRLMISMDSSNMHLATLAAIPVVSIWGATHHYAGFAPIGHNDHLMAEVRVEELGCRPCSVFGSKPCFRKDYACLNWLEPSDVMTKVEKALQESNSSQN
ncbi:MAG: glycosyltransferase family 9 protein [Owenweeksia sp.]|nr:glycosyltransferase family 9 protein [Owenweeksia sp.]